MLSLVLAAFSYLIGSFPTAYVVGRYAKKVDITKNGTGNVGAMNAYDVTGSKFIGISVAVIDILKGAAAVAVCGTGLLFKTNAGNLMVLISGLLVVLGHNYSVFIGFRGGRGLATAAGAMMFIQPLAIVGFLVAYFILRKINLRLYLSSVIGILAGFVPVVLKYMSSAAAETLSLLILLTIVSKHVGPLINELQNTNPA